MVMNKGVKTVFLNEAHILTQPHNILMAMNATENTQARRGMWMKKFVMLAEMCKKMTY